MKKRLKLKIIPYGKNRYYIVVGFNKKATRSKFIEKLGVCFFSDKTKILVLSIKRVSFWLNKGASISHYISFLLSSIMFKVIEKIKLERIKFFFEKHNINKEFCRSPRTRNVRKLWAYSHFRNCIMHFKRKKNEEFTK